MPSGLPPLLEGRKSLVGSVVDDRSCTSAVLPRRRVHVDRLAGRGATECSRFPRSTARHALPRYLREASKALRPTSRSKVLLLSAGRLPSHPRGMPAASVPSSQPGSAWRQSSCASLPPSALLFLRYRRRRGSPTGCRLWPLLKVAQAGTTPLRQPIGVDAPGVPPGSLGQALTNEAKQRHCRDGITDPYRRRNLICAHIALSGKKRQ
jgi:hypothetical protein